MNGFLTENSRIEQAITPTNGAAGTTDINGAVVDMAGFDSLMIIVTFGAITAGAATSIKAQQGAAANLSDAADLAGTAQTVADDDDDQIFVIDIQRVQERYARLVVDRGTQNAVVASATYIKYNAKEVPTTHASEVTVEKHAAPVEGTA